VDYMNLFRTIFLAADNRVSKTKVTALLLAVVNLAHTFGWFELTPEQLTAIDTVLVALFGIFLRDGVANP